MQRNKAIQIMSAHYLTEQFPENWHKWSEKKLGKFILDHASDPWVHWDEIDIFKQIDGVAIELCHYIKEDRKLQLLLTASGEKSDA